MNFTTRPQRPKPDPALVNGPEDIIVDGQVIGHLVAYQHGDRPRSYVAAINSRPNAMAAYDREPVHGSGLSPADAIAAAVAKGIAEKETALATLRALEARLEMVTA